MADDGGGEHFPGAGLLDEEDDALGGAVDGDDDFRAILVGADAVELLNDGDVAKFAAGVFTAADIGGRLVHGDGVDEIGVLEVPMDAKFDGLVGALDDVSGEGRGVAFGFFIDGVEDIAALIAN